MVMGLALRRPGAPARTVRPKAGFRITCVASSRTSYRVYRCPLRTYLSVNPAKGHLPVKSYSPMFRQRNKKEDHHQRYH